MFYNYCSMGFISIESILTCSLAVYKKGKESPGLQVPLNELISVEKLVIVEESAYSFTYVPAPPKAVKVIPLRQPS